MFQSNWEARRLVAEYLFWLFPGSSPVSLVWGGQSQGSHVTSDRRVTWPQVSRSRDQWMVSQWWPACGHVDTWLAAATWEMFWQPRRIKRGSLLLDYDLAWYNQIQGVLMFTHCNALLLLDGLIQKIQGADNLQTGRGIDFWTNIVLTILMEIIILIFVIKSNSNNVFKM